MAIRLNKAATQQACDQQPIDAMLGDYYLDDGYDDDPLSMPAPPPQTPTIQLNGKFVFSERLVTNTADTRYFKI
jgi:hypothetical protein